MGRRRRDDGLMPLLVQLAGLIFLLALISPQARQTLSALGFIAVCGAAVAILVLIGFLLYRYLTGSQRTGSFEPPGHCETLGLQAKAEPNVNLEAAEWRATSEQQQSQTTADLMAQLRAIDWFQFEQLVALVYRRLGYAVSRRGGANPDGGIDLVIEKDGQQTAVQRNRGTDQLLANTERTEIGGQK